MPWLQFSCRGFPSEEGPPGLAESTSASFYKPDSLFILESAWQEMARTHAVLAYKANGNSRRTQTPSTKPGRQFQSDANHVTYLHKKEGSAFWNCKSL